MVLKRADAKFKVKGGKNVNGFRVMRKWLVMRNNDQQTDKLVVTLYAPMTVENITLAHQFTPSVSISTDTNPTPVKVIHTMFSPC